MGENMKLETLINLKTEIDKLYEILEIMELDYLKLLDDDLWTIELASKPCFTRDYDIRFTTEVRLTKKYVIRFCEDYGLSLKEYHETDNGYDYIFELEKDIMSSVNKLEK